MTPLEVAIPLLWLGGLGSVLVLATVLARHGTALSGPEAVSFAVLAAGAATWAWAYALQLGAETLAAKLAYNHLVWVGIAAVGASWPVFGLHVAGDGDLLTGPRVAVLVGTPVAAAGLVITNPVHGLMFTDLALVGTPPRVSVTPAVGTLAFAAYSFVVDGVVIWRLARATRRAAGSARVRRGLVLLAGVLPITAGTVAFALQGQETPPVDFTPVMFAVTTVLAGVAVRRYRLVDTVSVARDHVVRRLSDPVVVVDGDGVVRAGNEAAERRLGVDGREGDTVDRAFADRPEIVAAVRAGEPTRVESTAPASEDDGGDHATDGPTGAGDASGRSRPRTYDVAVSPLDADEGATVLVFRDVTDRRRAEQRATVLNRVLRHDLRNDVAVIRGHLDMARERVAAADADLADADDSLEIAARRTDDVLALTDRARVAEDLADGRHETARLDLRRVVDDRVAQLRREHPDVEVSLALPEGPVRVAALEVAPSVVDNLLENAVEHADRDPPTLEVTLAVDADAGEATLRVRDDGPGIPENDRAALLGEPGALERASGLGLWLVNRVVVASGGRVEVTDARPRGTVVTVAFPLADESPTLEERAEGGTDEPPTDPRRGDPQREDPSAADRSDARVASDGCGGSDPD